MEHGWQETWGVGSRVAGIRLVPYSSTEHYLEIQVYSCEYQLTALSYFDGTDLIQSQVVPFYPPPDDAVNGACCKFLVPSSGSL